MNENNPTKSSYKTLSHSVSTTIMMKTNTKTPLSGCSTGRTTLPQKVLRSHHKLSSRHASINNDIQSTPLKKQLNNSVMLYNSSSKSSKKTRNVNHNQVAFFRCIPKSCTNIFKSTAIPQSHRSSETSTSILKLFSQYFPKQLIEEGAYSSNNQYVRLKLFSIISAKKKIMNLIPNDANAHKIKTPEEYLKSAYNPVLKFQKKIQVKHLTAIAKELAVNYSKEFSLSKKESFSQKYRLYPGVLNVNNESIDKEILKKMMNQNKKLNLEINKILKIGKKDNTLNWKKDILQKFKTIMIRSAIHFKRLNISIKDFYSHADDSIPPLKDKGRHELITAIKLKNIKEIYKLIDENTFLIHDFDDFKQTPLHWAAKRNVYQVISYMIRKGAYVDSRDQAGRTPLHIAVQMENIESIQFLLYGLANPFIKTIDGLLPIDYSDNYAIKFILQRSSLLHAVRKIGKTSDYEKGIKTGLEFLFNDELRTNFNTLKVDNSV